MGKPGKRLKRPASQGHVDMVGYEAVMVDCDRKGPLIFLDQFPETTVISRLME